MKCNQIYIANVNFFEEQPQIATNNDVKHIYNFVQHMLPDAMGKKYLFGYNLPRYGLPLHYLSLSFYRFKALKLF